MATAIRNATESETFDLAGQNVSTITHTIEQAFNEPLPLSEMIRITFITGAGKLGRQKYDEGAAKAVTSTLRQLGYEEDRASSCVVECGGTFKSQHDTGKNLKTVVVFPKIVGPTVQEGMAGMSLSSSAPTQSLLPDKSPEQMIAMSSKPVFERMLQSKCTSWSQKKGCVAAIESIKELVAQLDAKLLSGTPLSDAEQDLYDSVSVASLEEKEAYVKKQMHDQVESGTITALERNNLLQQVTDKLTALAKDVAEATGKPKRLQKLQATQTKLQARKAMLEEITPKPPHALRQEAEILKLSKELKPLQQIEDGAKGRLLTVKETQTLARKEEILDEIAQLEEASRGWFEEDDAFSVRVQASRKSRAAKMKTKPTKKSTSSSSSGAFKSVPSTKFVLPGAQRGSAWGKPAAKKKSSIPKGGGVFAAMMADSDSD